MDLSYASSCRGGGGGWVGCGLPAFDAMVAIGWFALNAGHWQIGGGVPTMAAPSPSGTIAWHRARRSTRPPTRPSADGRPPIDPGSVRRRGDGRAAAPDEERRDDKASERHPSAHQLPAAIPSTKVN